MDQRSNLYKVVKVVSTIALIGFAAVGVKTVGDKVIEARKS